MVMKRDNLIIFREKHGNRHFVFQNKEELQHIFFEIFNERLGEGFYPRVFINWLKEMSEHKDYNKVETFMHDRQDWEYEGFYSCKIEEIKNDKN